jgi:hypothetical protein
MATVEAMLLLPVVSVLGKENAGEGLAITRSRTFSR